MRNVERQSICIKPIGKKLIKQYFCNTPEVLDAFIMQTYIVTHGCRTFDLELGAFKMNFILSFNSNQHCAFKYPLPCKDYIFIDLQDLQFYKYISSNLNDSQRFPIFIPSFVSTM